MKSRAGKGYVIFYLLFVSQCGYLRSTHCTHRFTLEELKACGVTSRYARTIGVAVDHRRRNHSDEGLAKNTLRLKEYLSKLILFPLKGGVKATKGAVAEASSEQLKAVTQNTHTQVLPLVKADSHEAPRDVSKDEKSRLIYNYLRAKSRDEKVMSLLGEKNQHKKWRNVSEWGDFKGFFTEAGIYQPSLGSLITDLRGAIPRLE